jgi:alpha,alpha-trehalase
MLIDTDAFDAVLFDLDGVLTATANVHAACWKRLFDAFLQDRADLTSEPFEPFDLSADYLPYVDGKPRYDGVQGFLEARGIALEFGSPSDPPGDTSMCALGNRKDAFFDDELQKQGVDVYDGSTAFTRAVRSSGLKTAVVTSSRHGTSVIEQTGLSALFDCIVDGRTSDDLGLMGKPAPDIFLTAAHRLDVQPSRSVVVEDAIAGVQAGRAGGFGLVIGVDRKGDPDPLKANGANLVVGDLAELL